jgi:hypothetical protein
VLISDLFKEINVFRVNEHGGKISKHGKNAGFSINLHAAESSDPTLKAHANHRTSCNFIKTIQMG